MPSPSGHMATDPVDPGDGFSHLWGWGLELGAGAGGTGGGSFMNT